MPTPEEIKSLAEQYGVLEWRPIEGFDGYYVSPNGEVLSLRRSKGIVLKPSIYRDGYKTVGLVQDDGRFRTMKVHRLVALAYIPNPHKFPCVNHKDECKHNNNVDNLEWCSHKYNSTYGTVTFRMSRIMTNNPKISTPIGAYNQYGELIAIFPSTMEAARLLGFSNSAISAVMLGNRSHHKGLEWKPLNSDNTLQDLFGTELFNEEKE